MAPLICSFASPRSPSERIRSYIAYLERLSEASPADESFVASVETLLARARSWLPDGDLMPVHPDAPPR